MGRLSEANERALLGVLSDDMLLPLMQVKTALELLAENPEASQRDEYFQKLSLSTEAGIQLVEAYRLILNNQALPLEPVTVGPVLDEVAHNLTSYAKSYDTDIVVDVRRGLKPALAHRPSISVAMQCLVTSMVRSIPSSGKDRPRLLLAAHRSPNSTVTMGVFGGLSGTTQNALKNARRLQGRAHQPLSSAPPATTGGILIADLLCTAMRRPIKATRHNQLRGLAAVLKISRQLKLV